eukprot:m.102610 g.102610  ORF g.102610 m.102610 type:complete len:444 (-) comp15020_c0_seq1:266-1597(-)
MRRPLAAPAQVKDAKQQQQQQSESSHLYGDPDAGELTTQTNIYGDPDVKATSTDDTAIYGDPDRPDNDDAEWQEESSDHVSEVVAMRRPVPRPRPLSTLSPHARTLSQSRQAQQAESCETSIQDEHHMDATSSRRGTGKVLSMDMAAPLQALGHYRNFEDLRALYLAAGLEEETATEDVLNADNDEDTQGGPLETQVLQDEMYIQVDEDGLTSKERESNVKMQEHQVSSERRRLATTDLPSQRHYQNFDVLLQTLDPAMLQAAMEDHNHEHEHEHDHEHETETSDGAALNVVANQQGVTSMTPTTGTDSGDQNTQKDLDIVDVKQVQHSLVEEEQHELEHEQEQLEDENREPNENREEEDGHGHGHGHGDGDEEQVLLLEDLEVYQNLDAIVQHYGFESDGDDEDEADETAAKHGYSRISGFDDQEEDDEEDDEEDYEAIVDV